MQTSQKPIVLYDGTCNLCSGVVKFVISHDPGGKLDFASLQSETGKKLLASHGLDARTFDSFVFINKGKAFTKSTAALKLAHALGWPWRMAYGLIIVPGPIRNAVYAFIARNRYKWFGKKDSCMVPDQNIRKRFLDWGEAGTF